MQDEPPARGCEPGWDGEGGCAGWPTRLGVPGRHCRAGSAQGLNVRQVNASQAAVNVLDGTWASGTSLSSAMTLLDDGVVTMSLVRGERGQG